jgi:glucosamine--fructose-6-phosphate aminotransferase (isomerizing)
MLWERTMAQNQMPDLENVYRESFTEIDHKIRNLFTAGELLAVKKVYAVGDGDSYHAGVASKTAFLKLTGVEYHAIPAMKFLAYEIDCMHDYSPGQSMVLGISASGESKRVVQCLNRIKEKMPDARTVALTGNPNSSVAKAADTVFDVRLPNAELGMAPGIRTYTASLFGLTVLAIRLGEMQNRYHMTEANEWRKQIAEQSVFIPEIIEKSKFAAEKIKAYAQAPFFMFAGSGNHSGTATFSGAKLTEIAGIYTVSMDLEEWNHVECFSYPVDTPLVVIAPKGQSFDHALKLMENAKKIGHPVIAITNDAQNVLLQSTTDIVFPVAGTLEEHFLQLLFYIPSVSIGAALSEALNRQMFMTDNEAIQQQRAAMTKNLKEEV